MKTDKFSDVVKGVSWKKNIEKTNVKVYVDAKVETSIVEFIDKEIMEILENVTFWGHMLQVDGNDNPTTKHLLSEGPL